MVVFIVLSKVVNQHTELEHTPKKRNLYQQAKKAGIPFTIAVAGGWIHGHGIFTNP